MSDVQEQLEKFNTHLNNLDTRTRKENVRLNNRIEELISALTQGTWNLHDSVRKFSS